MKRKYEIDRLAHTAFGKYKSKIDKSSNWLKEAKRLYCFDKEEKKLSL